MSDITISYIDSPKVTINSKSNNKYKVLFYENNNILYESDFISGGEEASLLTMYHIKNLKIQVLHNDNIVKEDYFDLTDKRILMSFESRSIGDTLAWIGVMDKFREINKCTVIVSTFHNYLFKENYPYLEFIDPGTTVYNIYKKYQIGVFKEDFKMPKKLKDGISLQNVATSILGLDLYDEIVPKINTIDYKPTDKPYVCIAIHSTAQCKYWNKINGWKEVVKFLKNKGYEVYLLSKEGRSYMGNDAPNDVEWIKGDLIKISSIIKNAEFMVGISSGLSWLSWAVQTPIVLISSFTKPNLEFKTNCYRVYTESKHSGYYDDVTFDAGDWNWNPIKKCVSKNDWDNFEPITIEMVLNKMNDCINGDEKEIKKSTIKEELESLVTINYIEEEHRIYLSPKLSLSDVKITIDDHKINESYNFENFNENVSYYIEHGSFNWSNCTVEIEINNKIVQKTKLLEKFL